jgi:regulatory subunit for Cdc7p protein kinase
MSTIVLPPSPQVSAAMSSRRMPLANLNNATNSPLRATAVGTKRQRSHASEQRDVFYGQPAQKKQIIEVDDAEARRHGLVRRTGAPQTALTRKLEAARETKAPPKQSVRVGNSDLSTIVAWVRHYKKLFPQFIFYFDNVSSVHKDKIMSRAQILGSVCRLTPSHMSHL